MTDLRLDPTTHDIYVGEDGGTRLETGYAASVRQRLSVKLQLFAGEWFLNTRLGVPYYRDVLIKNPNFSVIRTLFRGLVSSDPDVANVPRLDMTLDGRTLTVDMDATLKDGSTVTVTYPPALATGTWADAPRLPAEVTPLQLSADPVKPWLVDLRLANGDIWIGDDGSSALLTGLAEATRQRLGIKLQLFLGEWFLNTRLGFPYYRDVLVKNPNFSVIRTLIRATALADAEVISVPLITMDFDSGARRLSVEIEVVIRDTSGTEPAIVVLPLNLVVASGDPVTVGGDYVILFS